MLNLGGGLGVLQPCSGGSPGVLQLVLGVGKVSCSPTLEVTQESYSSTGVDLGGLTARTVGETRRLTAGNGI
ncbi:hypothetical protein GDO81_023956 [Engystomops pustulosus]|uniref:Uncharacterized protein n=1 Tax=Engystomops pustulosus TaxID=76066 RepID=A0AAV6ZQB1_ENGPU|nr:hypothetical protein GDO81_023956 [Engystomops pustulosus]